MFRTVLCIGMLLSLLQPEEDRLLPYILKLCGATDAEQLDESVLERYALFAARPVRVNADSRGRMAELLTPYQVATLQDYRRRYGDILSLGELALVDGFGMETALALEPFVSFASSALPGAPPDSLRTRHSAVLRGGCSAGRPAWGVKYRLTAGRFEAAAAARKSYTEPPAGTAYLRWEGVSGKVVLGDFHTRFGQGIALWSGFLMEASASLDAFARHPTGIAATWSYAGTGCRRGLAADWQRGRVAVSSFVSAPGLKERMEGRRGSVSVDAGANLLLYGLRGQASLTCYHAKDGPSRISADARGVLLGADLFGETALDLRKGTSAGTGGFILPLGEHVRIGSRFRFLPTAYTGRKNGDYALSLGVDWKDGTYVTRTGQTGFGASVMRNILTLTLEGALLPVPAVEIRRRFRSVLHWQGQVSPSWNLDFRLTERLRSEAPRNRTDLRLDAAWSDGRWTVRGRANAVRSAGWAGLVYAEGGRTETHWSLWLRGTLFHADAWDDRIYCYERDVPGSFNVPAYYGRGCVFSLYGGWKSGGRRFRWKLHARAEWLSYPFMGGKKPGKAGLRLQGAADF